MTFVVPYIDHPISCEKCGKVHACGQGLYCACDHYFCCACFEKLLDLAGVDCTREQALAATEKFLKECGPVV